LSKPKKLKTEPCDDGFELADTSYRESFEVKFTDNTAPESPGLEDDGDGTFQEIDDESKCLNDSSQSGTSGKSPVWRYFCPGRTGAVCKLCRKCLKRSRGNTSNLTGHLKCAHREQFVKLMRQYERQKIDTAQLVCF